MRRSTVVAIAGLLAFSACTSDNTAPTPTEPVPEAAVARCRPSPFPVADLTKQIIKIFPVTGGLQAKALISEVAIGALWTVCKPIDAQKGAGAFVAWMADLYQRRKLGSASAQQVSNLTIALLKAVGLTVPTVPPTTTSPGDFGAGVFTGPTLTITTLNRLAGTQVPAGSFPVGTVITLQKLPDSPPPISGNVKPPFYEINAAIPNSTSHTLLDGKVAIVGFCVDDTTLDDFVTPAIAHGLSEGFEVLPLTGTGPLGLDCDPLPVPEGFGFGPASFGRQMRSLAQVLFLPQVARAAVAAGKSGLGGLARSLSPFGVTEGAPEAPNHISVVVDPSANYYFPFKDLNTCVGGCPPTVRILTPSNTQTGAGTSVHVTLLKVDGPEGEVVMSGTKDQTVQNFSSEGSDLKAVFPGLSIGAPGRYKLIFTAPGITPDTSDAFNVYTLAFSVQPSDGETTFTPADFLGQSVDGFEFPVVQISIVDFQGVRAAGTTARIHMSSSNGFMTGETNVYANDGIANFTQIMNSEVIVQAGLKIDPDGGLLENMTLNAAVIEDICPCGVIPLVTSTPFTVDGRSF